MTHRDEAPYYKSRVFKRLFRSYTLIIAFFLLLYMGWYLYDYRQNASARAQEQVQRQTVSWGTAMDQQLLSAQSLCASVNSSESCRAVLQTAYVEKKTIDSMQLYRLLNEMTRIKVSSTNLNVYSMLLGFLGDHKLYAPGNVLSITGEVRALGAYPLLRYQSVCDMLGVSGGGSMVLSKPFLIYADRYTGFGVTGSDRGLVLVLLEGTGLKTLAQQLVPDACGFALTQQGESVLSLGECSGRAFSVGSLVNNRLVYTAYLPETVLEPVIPLQALLPLGFLVLVGALFMVATYCASKRYYQPIDSIRGMLAPQGGGQNEMEEILSGIRSLIGERNGYRERMITITPYARQGMLRSMMSGGGKSQQLQVLIDEQFVELRKPWYMLGLVNLQATSEQENAAVRYRDAAELIRHVCAESGTEDCSTVVFARDAQHLYVIVSGEDEHAPEQAFYRLFHAITEAIDDPAMAVTIGVSRCEEDLDRLPNACRDAEQALHCMLSGGRGSLYFHTAQEDGGEKQWYFPKDAQKRMQHAIEEGGPGEIDALLEEIRRRNMVEADLPPEALEALVDEIHLAVRGALRETLDGSTMHIEVARVPMPATMEEVFSYYRHVFETALTQPLVTARAERDGDLDQAVCRYIEDNLYSPELSLSSVADQFGLSGKTIGVICKNRFGTTFLQYVRERQIQRAVELLQSSDLSLEQIAQQCGFTNLLTFRRNFKAVMQMNPSDFRK